METPDSDETLLPSARALVAAEKQRPDDANIPFERLSGRLSSTLGFAVASVAPVSPVASAPSVDPVDLTPAVKGLSLGIKGLLSGTVLFVLGAVVGGATVFSVLTASTPKTTPEVAPPPSYTQPAPTPGPVVPPTASTIPNPTPNPRAVAKSPEARPSGVKNSLGEENVLLERARTALLRQDFSAAFEALKEHERFFPQGRLSEERDALMVQALVSLERREEARLRAFEFRVKYPKSLLWPGVEAAVGADALEK